MSNASDAELNASKMADDIEGEEEDLEEEQVEEFEENNAEEDQSKKQIDFTLLDEKITQCMKLVFDPNSIEDRTHPRKYYIDKLFKYIKQRYDYNEFLVDKFFQLFGNEIIDAIEANENELPLTIRANYLKINKKDLASKLTKKNVKIEKSSDKTTPELIISDSAVPIGATTEYLNGLYTIQGAASLYPVIALDPQPNSKVLDLCAAPGGKTCFISALMKNTGVVYANEKNRDRLSSIFGNVHRLGVTNTIICNEDGRKFPNYMTGFDYVLVDAPCSGTGIVWKDKRVKSSKNSYMIEKCAELQKELLNAAIKCCKVGGSIVYSTCSILADENERVIDNALKSNEVIVIDSGVTAGSEGLSKFRTLRFHPSVKMARRFYPHVDGVDGFFFCKLQKIKKQTQNSNVSKSDKQSEIDEKSKDEKVKDLPASQLELQEIAEKIDESKLTLNFTQGKAKKIRQKRVILNKAKKKKHLQKIRRKDYQKAIDDNKKFKSNKK